MIQIQYKIYKQIIHLLPIIPGKTGGLGQEGYWVIRGSGWDRFGSGWVTLENGPGSVRLERVVSKIGQNYPLQVATSVWNRLFQEWKRV